jgi:hypothetical protein
VGTCQLLLTWPEPVCLVSGNISMSLVSAPSGHKEGTGGGLFVPNCRHGRVADRCVQFTRQTAVAQDGLYACRLLYVAAVWAGRCKQEHCQGRVDVGNRLRLEVRGVVSRPPLEELHA